MEETIDFQHIRIKAMELEIAKLKQEILNLKLNKDDN
tara:strand:+ start:574 stop:684 length:111 start_codon:yes stop_codon:yes gene_type:complete